MKFWWLIPIGIIMFLLISFVLVLSFICFKQLFYSPRRKKPQKDEYALPQGKKYVPHHAEILNWMKNVRNLPHEDMFVVSHDGLTLRGQYYECKKGAPVEILIHGYHGNSERDMGGGIERCFSMGRNALLVDQRACGKSDGRIVTFGINESRDCLLWIDKVIERFGDDVKIVITGVSMGAATVVMAAGRGLPENVRYVLADCPYSSSDEIIRTVMAGKGLPVKFLYPFVKLGARIYGGFRIKDASPLDEVKRSRTPIIFIHGDADDFVPAYMSEQLYEACTVKKQLVKIPNAAHVLAYITDKEGYVKALNDFSAEIGF